MVVAHLAGRRFSDVGRSCQDDAEVLCVSCRRSIADEQGAAGVGLAAAVRQILESELFQRLQRIEGAVTDMTKQQTVKEFYSTEEVATILHKAPYTVREWCRQGRINGDKRACGRGTSQEWMISYAELQRIRSEGLLPVKH